MTNKNNVNTDHYKQRLKKARRRRGLSAKQLLERKMNRRSIRQMHRRSDASAALRISVVSAVNDLHRHT